MITHFDTHNRQFADDLPLAAAANSLKALGFLPPDLDAGFVTVVASCVPETMGKRISADGETIPPSNLVEGYAVLLPFASADEFSAILQAVEHNQAISPQRLAGDRWEAAVVTKGRLNNSPGLADAGVVARTKDHFEGKGRGVVIIDYDPPSDGDALTRDELWSALTNVAPGLKAGGAVWWCSSSSYLYEGDVERVGLRGQRIYLLVEDTSDTPRVLAALNVRLWAKGLGRVEVSVAGSLLVRCLADEAMGTAARLDYIGGMVCEGEWSQRRPAPVVLADGGFIDTRTAVPPLTEWETRQFRQRVAEAKRARQAEADAVKVARQKMLADAVTRKALDDGVPIRVATERGLRVAEGVYRSVLTADFEVCLEDGSRVTVEGLLSDRDRYHGKGCLDPLEPEYRGRKVVGHLNLDQDEPTIFSHAHGGQLFSLQPRLTEVDRAVERLNKEYAVINVSGSVCVLREGLDLQGYRSLAFFGISDFHALHANDRLVIQGDDENKKGRSVPTSKVWMEHPDRRTYTQGLVFAPGQEVGADHYNLWKGFAVEPLACSHEEAASRCGLLLDHLRLNVCRGNDDHYRWFLAWMADMVQDPGRKKGTCAVLRGEQGTGKSKLSEYLFAMLGGAAFKASNPKHIVGAFNKHLADKLLVVAEESFFAGDKAAASSLKDLITSDTLTVEPKGIDAFTVRSCMRLMMITNSEWAINASADERRYFVLDVGEGARQNHDYFAAMDRQMLEEDGVRALLTFLQGYDVTGFNLRTAPKTEALVRQKRHSLTPLDAFIGDCLTEGSICGFDWADRYVEKGVVFDAYVTYVRARNGRPVSDVEFSKRYRLLTGSDDMRSSTGARKRVWVLPELLRARATFEAATGVQILDESLGGDE